MSARPRSALVRSPDPSFVDALGQQEGAPAINYDLALAQHRLYVTALQTAGLTVTELPPAAGLPDACFVQDMALVLPELTLLARPAMPSRQNEIAVIRPHLPDDRPVMAVEAPGTLEWGDVLRIDDTLYIGLSKRTNAAGVEQVRAALTPLGMQVETVQVPAGLHLLSGLSYLGPTPSSPENPGVVLAWETYRDLPLLAELDVIIVPETEAPAANVLALGGTVVVPAGFPHTAVAIWHRGFRVLSVSLSEFAKADGGVTCLSLLI
ncbi:MAG: hypothetical protein KDI03_01110 [Anaerolineae bacterium]|nr:hypothetical protein [Anaerolineae bacterium]